MKKQRPAAARHESEEDDSDEFSSIRESRRTTRQSSLRTRASGDSPRATLSVSDSDDDEESSERTRVGASSTSWRIQQLKLAERRRARKELKAKQTAAEPVAEPAATSSRAIDQAPNVEGCSTGSGTDLVELALYFRGRRTRLRFPKGSLRVELLAALQEELCLSPGDKLRFRDGDGVVVLLTPAIRSGLTLHAAVEHGRSMDQPALALASAMASSSAATAGPLGCMALARRVVWEKTSDSAISGDSDRGSQLSVASAQCGFWGLSNVFTGSLTLTLEFPSQRQCCHAVEILPGTQTSWEGGHLLSERPEAQSVMTIGQGHGRRKVSTTNGGPKGPSSVLIWVNTAARKVVYCLSHQSNTPSKWSASNLPDGDSFRLGFQGAKHGINVLLTGPYPVPTCMLDGVIP